MKGVRKQIIFYFHIALLLFVLYGINGCLIQPTRMDNTIFLGIHSLIWILSIIEPSIVCIASIISYYEKN